MQYLKLFFRYLNLLFEKGLASPMFINITEFGNFHFNNKRFDRYQHAVFEKQKCYY